jgi:hypothetical protein
LLLGEPVELGSLLAGLLCPALLPRLVHTVGIEERVQCHTCAAELTVERMLFHFIDKQLGQFSLHTTTVYLEQVAPVELTGIISRRSWNL